MFIILPPAVPNRGTYRTVKYCFTSSLYSHFLLFNAFLLKVSISNYTFLLLYIMNLFKKKKKH